MPTASVIMRFHRVTPFLTLAVRSILEQTFGDLELVLVDNGTGQGLAPFGTMARDARIHLLTLREHGGLVTPHNQAIAQSRGKFIILLDSDDVALPARVERQVAQLEARPELGLVSCDADTIDGQGRIIGREFSLRRSRDQREYTRFAAPVIMPAYAGRREVFERFPYRPEFTCGEDYDFLTRVAEVCPLGGVPEVLVQYRRYPEQTTAVRRSAHIASECVVRLLTARRRTGRDEGFAALLAEMKSWLDAPPPLPELYDAFAQRFLAEGFPELAVYHARKLLSVSRAAGDLRSAFRMVRQAACRTPRLTPLLISLFLRGPVRAYGLRDHPRHP